MFHALGHRRHRLVRASASFVVTSTFAIFAATSAHAGQFPTLDPNYVQEIYTGPVGGPGMAWTPGLNLLTRNGANIVEYSPTQNATYQSTPIHASIATHAISGLSSSGYGMTNAPDGYIYAVTTFGLQRFSPYNWSAPAQTLVTSVPGQGFGINCLPDGHIVYSDAFSSSKVFLYDPSSNTNTMIYDTATSAFGGYTVDDIETGPGGQIALAVQSNAGVEIINATGGVLSSFSTASFGNHYPDGLAFGAGPFANSLYSNNNDGTITRYDWSSAGWTGTPASSTDIASGAGAYGDLAAVGPDCAFYVFSGENGNLHGATPGVGTNWNAGTNTDSSITRIALANLTGGPDADCGFYSFTETFLPEPGVAGMLAVSTLLAGRRLRPAKRR
jgi:hypothetical protein